MHPDWRQAVLIASRPLAILLAIVVAGMSLLALVRTLTAPLGFFTQQALVLTSLALIGLLGLAVYALACRRVIARIRAWQVADQGAAAAALLTLCLTAVIVALPVLVATTLPQHPAP